MDKRKKPATPKLDTVEEVRAFLRGQLPHDINRGLWAFAVRHGYVQDVIGASGQADRDEKFDMLLDMIGSAGDPGAGGSQAWGAGGAASAAGSGGSTPGAKAPRAKRFVEDAAEQPYGEDTREWAMREAVCGFIERQVARRAEVVKYRRRLELCLPWPGGDPRIPDDFLWLLEQPLPRFLSFDQLSQHRLMPFRGASVKVEAGSGAYVRCTLEPTDGSGDHFWSRQPFRSIETPVPLFFEPWECLRVAWRDTRTYRGVSRHPLYAKPHQPGRPLEPAPHTLPEEDDGLLVVTPSMAGEAVLIAEKLARDYTLGIREALSLLGSGRLPRRAIIQGEHQRRLVCKEGTAEPDHLAYGHITMSVEPWAPAEDVAEFYRSMQRKVYGKEEIRLPGAEAVKLFSFANVRREAGSRAGSWRRLSEDFASEGTAGRDRDHRHFRALYQRVFEALFPLHYYPTRYYFWESARFRRRVPQMQQLGLEDRDFFEWTDYDYGDWESSS